MSVLATTYLALARFGGPSRMRGLITEDLPDHWRRGPFLAEAAYPDVLVARAVSDGTGLDLVLRPGDGPVQTTLGLQNLKPDTEYLVTGAVSPTVRADAGGAASLPIALRERTEVRIAPSSPG
jgi:hypothetical protein